MSLYAGYGYGRKGVLAHANPASIKRLVVDDRITDRQWAAIPRAALDISTSQASVLAIDQPRPWVR